MKPMLLLVTRWVDRPQTLEFTNMLLNAAAWEGTDTRLTISIHGKNHNEIDRTASLCELHKVNFDIIPNQAFPSINAVLFKKAIEDGYEYVGVLDDDAYIEYPVDFSMRALEAFTLTSSWPWGIEQSVGFVGPRRQPLHGEVIWSPIQKDWSCGGCQLYRAEALESMMHIWYPALLKTERFCDNMLHVCTAAAGYGTKRFYSPKYVHSRSQGTAGVYNTYWYDKSRENILWDFSVYRHYLNRMQHPNLPQMIAEMNSAQKASLKTLKDRAIQHGILKI